MTVFISKFISKMIGDKRRWRQYRARTGQLRPGYRTALEAVERYLMRSGIPESGDSFMAMFEDLVDLFEQAAADGTPIREIVGDDPVEFAEAFLRNYSKPGWNTGERARLSQTIERLESEGKDR